MMYYSLMLRPCQIASYAILEGSDSARHIVANGCNNSILDTYMFTWKTLLSSCKPQVGLHASLQQIKKKKTEPAFY